MCLFTLALFDATVSSALCCWSSSVASLSATSAMPSSSHGLAAVSSPWIASDLPAASQRFDSAHSVVVCLQPGSSPGLAAFDFLESH